MSRVAGIKASLFEPDILADYLLYRLNLRSMDPSYRTSSRAPCTRPDLPPTARYLESLPLPPDFTTPTNDLNHLLMALGTRIGAVRTGGELDLDAAQRFFLRSFQEGKFGPWTLDDLLDEGPDAVVEDAPVPVDPPVPVLTPASSNETLHALVSSRVKSFLDSQAREQARRAEGIAESATQEKKQERAKVTAERQAKWEAKVQRQDRAGALTSRSGSRSSVQARRR